MQCTQDNHRSTTMVNQLLGVVTALERSQQDVLNDVSSTLRSINSELSSCGSGGMKTVISVLVGVVVGSMIASFVKKDSHPKKGGYFGV
jgi:hypothetical protein